MNPAVIAMMMIIMVSIFTQMGVHAILFIGEGLAPHPLEEIMFDNQKDYPGRKPCQELNHHFNPIDSAFSPLWPPPIPVSHLSASFPLLMVIVYHRVHRMSTLFSNFFR